MMPTGAASVAPTWVTAIAAHPPDSIAATASVAIATPSRYGCAGANAVIAVGRPRRPSVNTADTLTAGGANPESRIRHAAYASTRTAMKSTMAKLVPTEPVTAYAAAPASGKAGHTRLLAVPPCTS
jgi:hypothetical protein